MHQLGTQVQSLCGGWSGHKFGELKCISAWRSQFMSCLRTSITLVFSTIKTDILLREKDKTNLCIYDVTIASKLPHRIYTLKAKSRVGRILSAFELTLFFSPWKLFAQLSRIYILKNPNKTTRTKPNRRSLKILYLPENYYQLWKPTEMEA